LHQLEATGHRSGSLHARLLLHHLYHLLLLLLLGAALRRARGHARSSHPVSSCPSCHRRSWAGVLR
jgi:hypothetical protein